MHMNIVKTSTLTGKINSMKLEISFQQWERLEKGVELIQDILPHLSRGEREFLITGITPKEWKEQFGEEE